VSGSNPRVNGQVWAPAPVDDGSADPERARDVVLSDTTTGVSSPRGLCIDGKLQLSPRRFSPLLLPVLRRPPLDRFYDQGRTVSRHLMADDDQTHVRPVLYAIVHA